LASLSEQTLPPSEVIVVDDGSTSPASIAGIERAMRRFPDTRLVRQANTGPSAARNRGVAECRSEYIMFLDCDDQVAPEAIATKQALFAAAGDVVATYAGIRFVDHNGAVRQSRYREGSGKLDPGRIGDFDGVPGVLWAYLFRAEAIRAIGGLDEELEIMEDFDALIRLGQTGATFAGCNMPLHIQNRRRESISRGSVRRQVRGALRFLVKAGKQRYFTRRELVRRYLQIPRYAVKIALYKIR